MPTFSGKFCCYPWFCPNFYKLCLLTLCDPQSSRIISKTYTKSLTLVFIVINQSPIKDALKFVNMIQKQKKVAKSHLRRSLPNS